MIASLETVLILGTNVSRRKTALQGMLYEPEILDVGFKLPPRASVNWVKRTDGKATSSPRDAKPLWLRFYPFIN